MPVENKSSKNVKISILRAFTNCLNSLAEESHDSQSIFVKLYDTSIFIHKFWGESFFEATE